MMNPCASLLLVIAACSAATCCCAISAQWERVHTFDVVGVPKWKVAPYLWHHRIVTVRCEGTHQIGVAQLTLNDADAPSAFPQPLKEPTEESEQPAAAARGFEMCWNLDSSKRCVMRFSPFRNATLVVYSRRHRLSLGSAAVCEAEGVEATVFQPWMPATLLCGMLLFGLAPLLSSCVPFRLAAGTATFVAASALILAFVLMRSLPGNKMRIAALSVMMSGYAVAALRALSGYWTLTVEDLLTNRLLWAYLACTSLLGLAVTYYFDDSENHKLHTILAGAMRVGALGMMAAGVSMAEAQIGLVAAALLAAALPWPALGSWGQQHAASPGRRPRRRRGRLEEEEADVGQQEAADALREEGAGTRAPRQAAAQEACSVGWPAEALMAASTTEGGGGGGGGRPGPEPWEDVAMSMRPHGMQGGGYEWGGWLRSSAPRNRNRSGSAAAGQPPHPPSWPAGGGSIALRSAAAWESEVDAAMLAEAVAAPLAPDKAPRSPLPLPASPRPAAPALSAGTWANTAGGHSSGTPPVHSPHRFDSRTFSPAPHSPAVTPPVSPLVQQGLLLNMATNRNIKIGGPTYNKLLQQGYEVDEVSGVITPPNAMQPMERDVQSYGAGPLQQQTPNWRSGFADNLSDSQLHDAALPPPAPGVRKSPRTKRRSLLGSHPSSASTY